MLIWTNKDVKPIIRYEVCIQLSIDPTVLGDDTPLIDQSEVIDSLSIVELTMTLEDAFGITLQDGKITQNTTVNELTEMVSAELEKNDWIIPC